MLAIKLAEALWRLLRSSGTYFLKKKKSKFSKKKAIKKRIKLKFLNC